MERETQVTKPLTKEKLAKKMSEIARIAGEFPGFRGNWLLSISSIVIVPEYAEDGSSRIYDLLDHQKNVEEIRRFILGDNFAQLEKTVKQVAVDLKDYDEQGHARFSEYSGLELTLPTTLDGIRYGLTIRSRELTTKRLFKSSFPGTQNWEKLMVGSESVNRA